MTLSLPRQHPQRRPLPLPNSPKQREKHSSRRSCKNRKNRKNRRDRRSLRHRKDRRKLQACLKKNAFPGSVQWNNTVNTAVSITHPIIHHTPIPRSILTVPLPQTATMSFTEALLPHRDSTRSRDSSVSRVSRGIITVKIWVCRRMPPISQTEVIEAITIFSRMQHISRTAVIKAITIISKAHFSKIPHISRIQHISSPMLHTAAPAPLM